MRHNVLFCTICCSARLHRVARPCTALPCTVLRCSAGHCTQDHGVTNLAMQWLQANLHGVLPVHQGSFASLQQNALRWSNRLKQACAVCHSLSMVGKTSVAGLDVERALFKAVEARFLVNLHHFLCHMIRGVTASHACGWLYSFPHSCSVSNL